MQTVSAPTGQSTCQHWLGSAQDGTAGQLDRVSTVSTPDGRFRPRSLIARAPTPIQVAPSTPTHLADQLFFQPSTITKSVIGTADGTEVFVGLDVGRFEGSGVLVGLDVGGVEGVGATGLAHPAVATSRATTPNVQLALIRTSPL